MQHDHINPAFDQDISQMDGYLVKMESSISEQLKMIRTAFAEMDVSLAQQIRRQDRRLNDLAINLERCAVGILARHQPVAEDLRHAVGVIKMSIEYERAGDYIKSLAKSVVRMAAYDSQNDLIIPSLLHIIDKVTEQFELFCKARCQHDMEAAKTAWLKDQMIDDLCGEIIHLTLDSRAQSKAVGNHNLVDWVGAAKSLERFGDKVKNLVEIFHIEKTGEPLNIVLD